MAIEFLPLPFAQDGLEPYISRTTLEFHYGKHHKKYVDTLNDLIKDTAFDKYTLDEILLVANGRKAKIYNNAGQTWNHNFMWKCLTKSNKEPSANFKMAMNKAFGSFENFKHDFLKQSLELFGSGWTWLVKGKKGLLQIHQLSNAGNPLVRGEIPLLTCDVWEHAYYIDQQNDRAKYLENYWSLINWDFVELNLEKAMTKTPRNTAKPAISSDLPPAENLGPRIEPEIESPMSIDADSPTQET